VSPRANLDIVVKREILAPAGNQTKILNDIDSPCALKHRNKSVTSIPMLYTYRMNEWW